MYRIDVFVPGWIHSFFLETLQGSETLQVGFEYRAAQKETRASTLTLYFDEPGLVQFFHMMGDRRRADDLVLAQRAAGHAIRSRHLFKDSETARVSKRAANRVKLLFRKNQVLACALHAFIRCPGSLF